MRIFALLLTVILVSCAHTNPPPKRLDPTKRALDNTVSLQKADGQVFCSGVVTEHVILTAAHCTEVPFTIYAELMGERFPVHVDKVWVEQDLATLSADRELGKGIPLAKNAPGYGDKVWVVGFPLGDYGKHLTFGIVSNPFAVDGIHPDQHIFFHQAPTLGGNSGGPVLNKHGRIIGITSFGVLQSVYCPLGCPGAYQDSTLHGSTHLFVIRSLFGKRV